MARTRAITYNSSPYLIIFLSFVMNNGTRHNPVYFEFSRATTLHFRNRIMMTTEVDLGSIPPGETQDYNPDGWYRTCYCQYYTYKSYLTANGSFSYFASHRTRHFQSCPQAPSCLLDAPMAMSKCVFKKEVRWHLLAVYMREQVGKSDNFSKKILDHAM